VINPPYVQEPIYQIKHLDTRVARWYIFKPKLSIWGNFGGSCNGSCWYILWPFDLFYGHLVYFFATLYIYGIFFPVLVCCTKKNLATLLDTYLLLHNTILIFFYLPRNLWPSVFISQSIYYSESLGSSQLSFFDQMSFGRLGLPAGIFSCQNFQFGCILEGIGMKNVGIF
jgi:hypothetical protein